MESDPFNPLARPSAEITPPAAPAAATMPTPQVLQPETAQSRATLAQAIRTLQTKGDNSTIAKLVTAYKAKYTPQSAMPAKNLGDLAADEYMGSGKKIVESVQRAAGKYNPDDLSAMGVVKNVGALGEGLLGSAAGVVQGLFAPVTAVLKKAFQMDPLKAEPGSKSITATDQKSVTGEALKSWIAAHPDAARNLVDAFTVATTAAGGEAGLLGKTVSETSVSEATNVARQLATDTAAGLKSTAQAVAHPIEAVSDATSKAADKIQSYYAAKNVNPQLESSVGRLQEAAPLIGAGAARQKSLVELYDDFAKQEGKHIADIKEDPAISLVGERIGDEFNNVMKMRRAAGETMSSELEKTAKVPVDTQGAFGDFQKELLDNGAAYDSVKKELSAGPESKFSSADKGILEEYAAELQKLGSNPSMKVIDAFISRIPKEVEGLKASRGITFDTNAERLIRNNLNSLRTALKQGGTPEYTAAREQYSKLSNFIDEGVSHLGKLTQSGDFARDASMAKSAVQSVLNNGKKDWLVKLEDLTGYPALDEATLALQAMKDAGDFKGNSLLDLLSNQASISDIPRVANSFGGAAFHAVKTAGAYAKGKVVGTPAEQTRAYLKAITDAKKKGNK